MYLDHSKFYFERQARVKGFSLVAGVDEAGRGPLAGPVVAAAVILPEKFDIFEIDDSKKLTEKKRKTISEKILSSCHVGVGIVDNIVIDEINIRNATFEAMRNAVLALDISPDYLLIDGNACIDSGLEEEAVVKGDSKSFSIGAASIIAKVRRDEIMKEYSKEYPQYSFERHKGYPTKLHKELIAVHGLSPIHRRTFNWRL